jgi:Hint domain
MTTVQENLGAQRTRRNIMKMGAILSFAALQNVSKTDPASANCGKNGKPVGEGCESGNAQNCFLKGTKIQTAEGEHKVEDLAIDDLLPTMFGGLRPVQWIGRYPIQKSDPCKPCQGRIAGSHRSLRAGSQCPARRSPRDITP